MKTVKEVSEITGLSIRTLRYYDEIGLLKPSQLTDAGYRLYDAEALAKLQEILFYRELDLPLLDIKKILEHPDDDRTQTLLSQRALLEKKRNHLNGVIELIHNVIGGVNTMNFETLNEEEITRIIDHLLDQLDAVTLHAMMEQYGSMDALRLAMEKNLGDEKLNAELIKIYGSKEKAMNAGLNPDNHKAVENGQTENDRIYHQFAMAKETSDNTLAVKSVQELSECYKNMFHLDDARYLLLELAKEYADHSPLEKATDTQYGDGVTQYIANAIQTYYGEVTAD